MRDMLYDYDIFPKVFPIERDITITVKSMGKHSEFKGEYTIRVNHLGMGDPHHAFYAGNVTSYGNITPNENGELKFTYKAESEGEYLVRVFDSSNDSQVELSVYALEHDLACRYPLKGDLHVHTCCSDGGEAPDIVCANYRKIGYDFIVITDHHYYQPSLDAIRAYQDTNISLNILPGEEVHLPYNEVHIVNAGGLYSVNSLITDDKYNDARKHPDMRRLSSDVVIPDGCTKEEYKKELDAIVEKLTSGDNPLPEGVEPLWYASCLWAFDKIREADGLAIFAHPYWRPTLFQIPEAFTAHMMKEHPFDAFEVLGGEMYFHQNGIQTALYYDEYRQGRIHPIVGSTDSHGSTENNRGVTPCHTIVFAEKNERSSIISAIKDRYSVAVDTISAEYRLVGEFRLQKYAAFLMEEYFPLHNRETAIDGALMFSYINGETTKEELEVVCRRTERILKKYFELL